MTADAFGGRMRAHLENTEARNSAALAEVAGWMLETVRADGRIHVTGTGHSTGLILEAFYRAGGLACINPVLHAGLIPLLGGMASTVLERSDELAPALLEQAAPLPTDLAFVFSNSGVNPLPIALAKGLRAAGTRVVAVSSLPSLRAAPARAAVKLDQIADALLDTGTPPGDAAFEVDGMQTAALSSLTSVYLWNLLLARLARGASQAGVGLPLWTSANTAGGDERNAELFTRYRSRVPLL